MGREKGRRFILLTFDPLEKIVYIHTHTCTSKRTLPLRRHASSGGRAREGIWAKVSPCSSTVNDFHSAVSRHHINHIRFTQMPDCHMQSDSSTFHTVNPGEEKIERQKVGEREGEKRCKDGEVSQEKEWDIISGKKDGGDPEMKDE